MLQSVAGADDPNAHMGRADQKPDVEYVGTRTCRMCHDRWYRSLEKSPKGDSWRVLQPGVQVEVKERAGLSASADFRRDARCLECHTVGYEMSGGYQIPSADDQRAQRKAADREGVGCESCHGPGGGFVEVMRDILRSKRTYRPSELHAAGLRVVRLDHCRSCHNQDAPCVSWRWDDQAELDAYLETHWQNHSHGGHESLPLQYRVNEPDRHSSERLPSSNNDEDIVDSKSIPPVEHRQERRELNETSGHPNPK